MSPSNFNSNSNANEFNVTSTGELNGWNNVNNGYGVRPISNSKKRQQNGANLHCGQLHVAVQLQQLEQR